MQARSHLYVPGDRPDRLAKALSRGADALIVDLEDSVASASKAQARQLVVHWLAQCPKSRTAVWVRVNAGVEREADVAALAGSPNLTGLVLAKTDSACEVADVAHQLSATGSDLLLAPLIESAAGVCAAGLIASGPRVAFLHLGELDLAADLGASPAPDGAEFHYVRSLLVLCSRAANIGPPVAPVDPQVANLTQFRATTDALSRLGFFGRACVHPTQVTVANDAFTPHPDEILWARELLDSFATRSHGVGRHADGQMVDEAVLRRARQIIARAQTYSTPDLGR